MLSKKEKAELNIANLRNMLNDEKDDVKTIALSIHQLASSVELIITNKNNGELMEAIIENLNTVSKDMHDIVNK